MSKHFQLLLFAIIITLCSCQTEEKLETYVEKEIKSVEDLNNVTLGVLMGSIYDSYAHKEFPNAKIVQYHSVSDLIIGLETNKIDAFFTDLPTTPEVLTNNPNIKILIDDLFYGEIAAGFNKQNPELREKFNQYLAEITADGTYEDIENRWMIERTNNMPTFEVAQPSAELKVGVVSDIGLPYAFIQDNRLIGFDIEIAERFAVWLGWKFTPVPLQFGSLLASLSTNKIDIITAAMMITEERQKQVDFSEPYYKSAACVLVRKQESDIGLGLTKLDDISAQRIGILTGTVHDAYVTETFPKAKLFRFDQTSDMLISLKTNKIDVAMLDLITAGLAMKRDEIIGLLSDEAFDSPLGVGFRKDNPELRKEFNQFLAEIKADGSYDIMHKRWFVDDVEQAVMPEFENPESDKVLRVGVAVEDLPYVAIMNGKYVGFDIEMIQSFAQRRNYNLKFSNFEFPALIAALASGKVDMISDGISISEERALQIDFSDPYADFRTAVVALKSNLKDYEDESLSYVPLSFYERVISGFHSNIIKEQRYLLILDGLLVTIIISIFAALFGTLVGGMICYMRMSKNSFLLISSKTYISLIRGTPVLVLLMIIYYIVFASINFNPVLVSIIAFGLNFAAYVSEMFRTSIESIPKGQREAGIASGFTKFQTFIHIIMPQAICRVLPVYKGEFISLLKMTSVVGYIAVQDLTRASDIIRSRTFDAFFPLIMAAIIYLILAWLLTLFLDKIEISIDPYKKRLKASLKVKK